MNRKMKIRLSSKNIACTALIVCAILFAAIFAGNLNHACAQSSDAIGVRTVPNPDHVSPLVWYKENIKIQGSPQSITVDGYYAIRDGRSVYINIGNISGGTLYTNIYVISFNQKAENATEDIFGNLLGHLKFNRNVRGIGMCSEDNSSFCAIDNDCLDKGFCVRAPGGQTVKAEVVRDVLRMSDISEIKSMAESYKMSNGTYPKLGSGTYLPNKTMSVWPSWKETLGKMLGSEPPLDPINRLGNCGGLRFKPETCWDEKSKTFAADYPNTPAGSWVYLFYVSDNALSYGVCAVMESGFVTDLADGACPGSQVFSSVGTNNPPQIQSFFFPNVQPGGLFAGMIRAFDPDGDTLSWAINTGMSAWNGWSAPPVLVNTMDPYAKELRADSAGDVGPYVFSVIVRDPEGLTAARDLTINVSAALCNDLDADGWGNPGSLYCSRPERDCDDMPGVGAAVNPGAAENCVNGIDDDCDGLTDANDPACSACDNVCDGVCASGCNPGNDPDCGCVDGNSCCGALCSHSTDSDCAAACGDGVCVSGEYCVNCSVDCGACGNPCGDGFCDTACNECVECEADCGCGNGECNIDCGECTDCPSDCPSGTPGC
jgi:hypothetical protein